ncbi:MAG: transglycosylase SLT domain-containing protein, partial [Betaproteobacteria bacterium]|nr:transglycosylase SLT domain-containing protein [Betaproteobacteria bacterium]
MAAGCAATPPSPSALSSSTPGTGAVPAPGASSPQASATQGSKPGAAGSATGSTTTAAVAEVPALAASATMPATDASQPLASQGSSTPAAPVQYTDIWQRIRGGFGIPDMDGPEMQPYVQEAVHWYTTRPDYVARMTERSRKYLYYIVQEVQRRGMPTELALLPFIESAFNPDALSSAKASGMWQFMPSTGKNYNLRQTMFQDGRRDVMASTRAALDYLAKLHGMFGDWKLALAAYNWGEGGLQRAIARNQARGLPVDYAHLNMPAETRNYYPKLQAVKDIIEDPQRYGITLPVVPDHPYFKPVSITQDMDVTKAARLAGISVSEFRSLNPAFKKPVILAATHPQILLPYDNATQFEQALADHHGPLARWTAYQVEHTSTPAALAKRLHLPETTLRDVNDIPGRILIKAGS